jgi:hypothetical protein
MSDSFKTVGVILLSILLIYILIHIFRRMNRNSEHHHHNHHKENTKSKCGSESCLDKYEYNDCPCHKNKHNNKPKELFTMAQSVFPLHAPTLPAFSQILNENMSNISDSYMEHTDADPLTRDFPSQETSTGFFNVKGDALPLQ